MMRANRNIAILLLVIMILSPIALCAKKTKKVTLEQAKAQLKPTTKTTLSYKTTTSYSGDVQLTRCQVIDGDTFPMYTLPTLWVYPKLKFKNKTEEQKYYRLVRDVKKTLPLSKYIKQIIIETNDTLLMLSTKKERDAYMKGFEKRTYKREYDRFSRLTLRQGMLLIRLVDRECDATSYELIKTYRGTVRAGFYQMFAGLFGASLKTEFGKNKDDELIERIINMVESGQL